MRVEPRPTPAVRCVYCHGSLGPVFNRCPACRTALHLDCWQRLPACPILGCAGKLGAAPKPQRGFLARWWWVPVAQVALAVGVGLVAAFSEAEDEAPPVPAVPAAVALEAEPFMLEHVLSSADSPEVTLRLGAVISLGKHGGPGAVAALARGVEDRDRRVRLQSLIALTKRLKTIGLSDAERRIAWRALGTGLASSHEATREAAAWAHGGVASHRFRFHPALGSRAQIARENTDAIAALDRSLQQDSAIRVRVAAAEALGRLYRGTGEAAAHQALIRGRDDPNWQVRQAVNQYLDPGQSR